MSGFGVRQAARIGGCSRSTVLQLIKKGLLRSTPGPRNSHCLEYSKEELSAIIRKNSPSSGYAQRPSKKKKLDGPAVAPSPSLVKMESILTNVEALRQWMSIPKEKRSALMELAEKFDEEMLRTLLVIAD